VSDETKEREWMRGLLRDDNPSWGDVLDPEHDGNAIVSRAVERWRMGADLAQVLLFAQKDLALLHGAEWHGQRYVRRNGRSDIELRRDGAIRFWREHNAMCVAMGNPEKQIKLMLEDCVIGTLVNGEFQGRYCHTDSFEQLPQSLVRDFDSAQQALAFLFEEPHDAWWYSAVTPDDTPMIRRDDGRFSGWYTMDWIGKSATLRGYVVIDQEANTATAHTLIDGKAEQCAVAEWEADTDE
jgi:hypothetical protein